MMEEETVWGYILWQIETQSGGECRVGVARIAQDALVTEHGWELPIEYGDTAGATLEEVLQKTGKTRVEENGCMMEVLVDGKRYEG